MTDHVHNRTCGAAVRGAAAAVAARGAAAVARGAAMAAARRSGKGRGSSAVVASGCSSGVAARAG